MRKLLTTIKVIRSGHSCKNRLSIEVSRSKAKRIGKSSSGIPQNVQEILPKFDTAGKIECCFNMFLCSVTYSCLWIYSFSGTHHWDAYYVPLMCLVLKLDISNRSMIKNAYCTSIIFQCHFHSIFSLVCMFKL